MDVLQALAQALGPHLGEGFKASGTPTNAPIYGTAGLFGRCDGPATLINAMVGPSGFEKELTWVGTNTEREFIDVLVATSSTGSEQTTACGDCPTVNLTACAQLYCFGRFCKQTKELQFDKIGLRSNANVPTKALFGNITDSVGNVLISQGENITDEFMLQSKLVGYHLALKNNTMLWNGNPQNNDGCYQEYKGFELIINTGKFDQYTELDCDGIDSFLLNFGFNNPASDGTYAIVSWFERMVQQFTRRANGAGFNWQTSTMHIVMTSNMWNCVARAYSCAGIELCTLTGNNRMNISADQARDRREEFESRMALPILGRWYPISLDDLIPETPGQANGICSDIYFITTDISGETVVFGQYQDFNETYGATQDELKALFETDDIAIIDNGRFAIVRDNTRGCFDIQIVTKPRLVSTMPWLSGRLQNVCCNVLGEPFPDVTGSGRVYEKTGGRTTTPIPTLYDDCVDC